MTDIEEQVDLREFIGRDIEDSFRTNPASVFNIQTRGPIKRVHIAMEKEGKPIEWCIAVSWLAQKIGSQWRLHPDFPETDMGYLIYGSDFKSFPYTKQPDGSLICVRSNVSFSGTSYHELIIHKDGDNLVRDNLLPF